MDAKKLVLGGLAAGAAVVARRTMDARRIHQDGAGDPSADRWHVVFVNLPPEQVVPDGRLPEPLAELGDRVEVQVRPAVGRPGTALRARLRTPVPTGAGEAVARVSGKDPRQEVRRALRAAKSLLETGEVLSPDRPGSARRTLKNLPLELAVRRARSEGRL